MVNKANFQPDWASPPGDTIADLLEEREVSTAEFAKHMRQTLRYVEELLDGRALITIDTAQKLEAVLGPSAQFWMVRESQYRDDVNRLELNGVENADSQWLDELPWKDMVKFGWVKPCLRPADRFNACLQFFGVPDVQSWREAYKAVLETSSYRTSPSFESRPAAVAAWLRQAEIQSESIDCKPWNASHFRETLWTLRALTRQKNPRSFIPELVRRCADCGVAVVIVRAPSECRASGATRFLSPNKALLVLSFRYLSDDHFWFSFFHEAAHVLLHGKKVIFLEGDKFIDDKKEQEANNFAARTLIPPEFQAELSSLRTDSMAVIRFARRVGVSPGIVVGQLQHRGLFGQEQLNRLKRRFAWLGE